MVNILYVYHTLVLLFVFIYSIVSLVGQVKETFAGMLYIPNKPDNVLNKFSTKIHNSTCHNQPLKGFLCDTISNGSRR